MSISNINTLQNPIELSYLSKYTTDYLIQSLSNAGQKLGVKGDGIKFNNFTFYDIFKKNQKSGYMSTYTSDKYVGYIQYDSNQIANYGFVSKNNISKPALKETDNNTYNNVEISNFAFDYIINNIDKYVSYGNKLSYKDDRLYTILFGKLLNKEDNIRNNIEIIYNKIDEETGFLEYAIRVFHLYTNGVSNVYAMLVLKPDYNTVDKDKSVSSNELNYALEVYKFDTSLLESNELKQYFENLFNYSYYNENSGIMGNPLFINNNLFKFDEESLFHYVNESNCTLYGLIKNHELNNKINYIPNNVLSVVYNSSNENHFSIDITQNNNYQNINNILKDNIDIASRIYFFNNDLIYNYSNFVSKYSHDLFTSDIDQFYRKILFNIYEYLNHEGDQHILYVPLDYKFNYLYNSNNQLEIYKGENIFVTTTSLNDKLNKDGKYSIFEEPKNLIFDNKSTINEYIENIFFDVIYHSKFEDKVIKINVDSLYTLPYINKNNNWVINNSDSNVNAVGKNAGNPNIIILFNYKKENNEVDLKYVCSASALNQNIESYITDNKITRFIKINGDKLGLDPTELYSCEVLLPKITEYNKNVLENSLVILLSDTKCVELKETEQTNYTYLSSIWYINNNTDDNYDLPQFSLLTDNDLSGNGSDIPLDFTDLLNVTNIIDSISARYSEKGNPIFNSIAFSIPSNTKLDGNSLTKKITNTINIETTDYYKQVLTLNQINEENVELNSDKIKYNNQLNYSIKSNQKNAYFINNLSELKNDDISSVPYPVICEKAIVKETQNINDIITAHYGIGDMPISVQSDDVYINGIEEYSQSVAQTSTKESLYKYYTTNTNESVNTSYGYEYGINVEKNGDNIEIKNHEEYVFNTNIPTLDLQEIFLSNNNTLNRLNIISVENTDPDNPDTPINLYNAYFGSSFDEKNKNCLHIGTTKTNINIGTHTLLSYTEVNKFNTHDTISIDFDNIVLNSNLTETDNIKINDKLNVKNNYSTFNINKYDVNISDNISDKTLTYYEFEYDKISSWGFMNKIRYIENENSNIFSVRHGLINYNRLVTIDDKGRYCDVEYFINDTNSLSLQSKNEYYYNTLINYENGLSCHIVDTSYYLELNYCNESFIGINGNETLGLPLVDIKYLKDKDIFMFENFNCIENCMSRKPFNDQYYTPIACLNNMVNDYINSIYPELNNTGIDKIKPSNLSIKYFLNSELIGEIKEDTINIVKEMNNTQINGISCSSNNIVLLFRENDGQIENYDISTIDDNTEFDIKKELNNLIKYYLFPLPIYINNNSFFNHKFNNDDTKYFYSNNYIDPLFTNYNRTISSNDNINKLLKLRNKIKFLTYKENGKYYLEVYYTDENVSIYDFIFTQSYIRYTKNNTKYNINKI